MVERLGHGVVDDAVDEVLGVADLGDFALEGLLEDVGLGDVEGFEGFLLDEGGAVQDHLDVLFAGGYGMGLGGYMKGRWIRERPL